MGIKTSVQNIHKQVEKMKKEIIEEINKFEQNPKIKPLNKNCFVIMRSDLSKDLNLSPFYYNFKIQYEYISKVIEKSKIESVLNVLQEIVKTKKHKEEANDIKYFNPIVIDKIKSLI